MPFHWTPCPPTDNILALKLQGQVRTTLGWLSPSGTFLYKVSPTSGAPNAANCARIWTSRNQTHDSIVTIWTQSLGAFIHAWSSSEDTGSIPSMGIGSVIHQYHDQAGWGMKCNLRVLLKIAKSLVCTSAWSSKLVDTRSEVNMETHHQPVVGHSAIL